MTTILIVDDEAGTLLLLQSLLKSNGYAVKTAGDGASALEIVKAGGIDIQGEGACGGLVQSQSAKCPS